MHSNETAHPQTKPATYPLEISEWHQLDQSETQNKREKETEVGNNLVNKQLEKTFIFAAWKINTWRKKSHHFVIQSSNIYSQQGSWCKMATTTELWHG